MSQPPITKGAAVVETAAPRARRLGELVFIGIILVFSIVALVMTGAIREPVGSSNVLGARVLPYAINGLMLVASVAAAVAVLRGDVGTPEDSEDLDESAGTSWRTVLLVVLSFASLLVTIPYAGWPIAVTIMFTGASLALGARSWWKALLIGAGLGVLTYLVFGQVLGLSLPLFGTEW
ncbi:tripartite tricarboxylate transporter TctB family protein [Microbacterium rhizophilus]|uniref:tripartite tricarboxylate transporter TctB family protein n=1 Tax=Microbacterium rhizophilus TaxID=3138934 RepID=UPI0031EF59B6